MRHPPQSSNSPCLPTLLAASPRNTAGHHHAGTHRIKLNIAVARQQVGFGLGQAGTEPAFPQRPGALIAAVEILHITLPQLPHHLPRTLARLRRQQQMNVIGHQHISMHRAAALDDVPGNAGERRAGAAGPG